MGDETREWMEGKLYRYDLEHEQLTRMVDGYDWGFYPMEGGVAIYTSGDLSFYNDLGGLERSMYAPEAYAVLSGGGDAVIVYEPTTQSVTYAFADGTTASAAQGEPGYVAPAATPGAQETAAPEGQESAQNTGDNTTSTGGDDGFTPGGDDWYEQTRPSGDGSGSGSGGSGGGSGSDVPTFTEKDS